MSEEDLINAGDYVIIQRQSFTKLHKLKPHGTVSLGRDQIELENVIGKRYYSTFKMVTRPKNKRVYTLEEAEYVESIQNLNIDKSGVDNRNIMDDGSSQRLSIEEIQKFRDEALSSSDIVEKLVTNSKTFSAKTEYSQEKYLKKKEKKYFEYIQVRRPTLRLISEIYYKLDPGKIQGIRIDDLSQILAYANIQPDSNILLYDSGTSGLLPAAITNGIGKNTTGTLIHMHPGNVSQKEAFLAMKFPTEQRERCINVCLYSVLRCYYQEYKANDNVKSLEETIKTQTEEIITDLKTEDIKTDVLEDTSKTETKEIITDTKNEDIRSAVLEDTIKTQTEETITHLKSGDIKSNDVEMKDVESNVTNNKRKHTNDASEASEAKRPCWQIDNERACKILENKVDSLVIVAKEHPSNILRELLSFLNYGKPFVVFSLLREPLENLYVELKNRTSYIALNLSNNLLRNYQVLENRTHPDVNMTCGGYILTGFKVDTKDYE